MPTPGDESRIPSRFEAAPAVPMIRRVCLLKALIHPPSSFSNTTATKSRMGAFLRETEREGGRGRHREGERELRREGEREGASSGGTGGGGGGRENLLRRLRPPRYRRKQESMVTNARTCALEMMDIDFIIWESEHAYAQTRARAHTHTHTHTKRDGHHTDTHG